MEDRAVQDALAADADHGLPAPGRRVTMGRFDEVAGYRVLRPRGRPEWMFTLTLAGRGRFRVGGSEVVALPGDLVLVPPFVPQDYGVHDEGGHDAGGRDGGEHWAFFWAHSVVRAEWQPVLDHSRLQRISLPASHLPAVGRAFAEALTHRRTGRALADRLAMNCLERALLLAADARDVPPAVDPAVARVLEHVETHLEGDLSTRVLARVAGMSVSHLGHVFTLQVGTPVQRHVERRRMDLATQLLDVSDEPVAAIARRCGFVDPLYFSRRFRGAHGMSPSAYRERVEEPAERG